MVWIVGKMYQQSLIWLLSRIYKKQENDIFTDEKYRTLVMVIRVTPTEFKKNKTE